MRPPRSGNKATEGTVQVRWHSPLTEPFQGIGAGHVALLIAVVVLGAYVRFSELPGSELGTDEAEKYFSSEEFRSGRFWVDLEHPPLEKYMIFISTSVLGPEVWAIKLPNVVLGSLMPLAMFLVGWRIGKDPWTGQLAALLSSLSPLMIGYSLVAKEDTPVNLFSVLLLLYLSFILERGREKKERTGTGRLGSSREGPLGGKAFRTKPSIFSRLDPRTLNGVEISAAVLFGLALSSKYSFVFYAALFVLGSYVIDRQWMREKGLKLLALGSVLFITLSWYYLNPYWAALGMGHWLWEIGTGHTTLFLGEVYDFPPPWFYPVVMSVRIEPPVLFGSLAASAVLIAGAWKVVKAKCVPDMDLGSRPRLGKPVKWEGRGGQTAWGKGLNGILQRLGALMIGSPALYLALVWFLGSFIVLTLLPFKGNRYVLWMLPSMVLLTAWAVRKGSERLEWRSGASLSYAAVILLMTICLARAAPYYKEVHYFGGIDTGAIDLDGAGLEEAFEWLDDRGREGCVSMRWTRLGGYYWDNVTSPVSDMRSAREGNVSYILLYRADTERGIEKGMTDFARSMNCTLLHEVRHGRTTLVWVYGVNRARQSY